MKKTILTLFSNVVNFIKENKKLIIISIIIILIILLILFLISMLSNNKIGNSNSNLQNQGIATIEKKKIYYIQTGENAGIYKTKQNKDKSKMVVEGITYYLNSYKNYLYYIELDEKELEFNIIKIKQNGKEKQVLVQNVDLNLITVVDNWVYYFENNQLHRIRINGKDKMKIYENEILNYKVEGNYIYYIYFNGEKNILARQTLEGKNFLKLSENVSGEFEIIGNKIYYIEQKYNTEKQEYEYSLYKMNQNGKSRKQIIKLPNSIDNVNILKNEIYYTLTENYETYMIYKHEYKEENARLIKETKTKTQICIVGKSIFYTDKNEEGESTVLKIIRD